MTKPIDPGLDKHSAEAKILRQQAWKRPKTKVARDKYRQERVDAARGIAR